MAGFGIKGEIDDIDTALAILNHDTDEALKYIEWWFIGKNDGMAELINTDIRSGIQDVINKVEETK